MVADTHGKNRTYISIFFCHSNGNSSTVDTSVMNELLISFHGQLDLSVRPNYPTTTHTPLVVHDEPITAKTRTVCG